MIRADHLKDMVDSTAKALSKTDQQVVGISVHGGILEVFAAGSVAAMRCAVPLEGRPPADFLVGVDPDEVSKVLGGCGSSECTLGASGTQFQIGGVIRASFGTKDRNPEIRVQTTSKYEVSAEWFRRCCLLAPRFASKERGRYSLNAAHFEIVGDRITFVATDGRKMCYSDEAIVRIGQGGDESFNLPVEAASSISSALPPSNNVKAMIEVGPAGFKVSAGTITYWCAQIEGQFPDWRSVVPEADVMAPVDGKMLNKFASILSALEVMHATFESDGTGLKIYGKSPKIPDIETKLDVALPKYSMLLDPGYLAAAMFENSVLQFGWSKPDTNSQDGKESRSCAFFVSPPFTAFCMSCEA